jgi:hypothetical protein
VNEFPDLRAALVAAAERQRHLAAAGSDGARKAAPRRRSWWPLQLRAVAIAVVALLGIAAVALAAAGVFSPGRPVAPVSVPQPRAFDGAAIPSTIRLLAVRAEDPAGGPAWGLRLVDTTRGEVCVAPGRVQDGIIGVVGRDRAFGDDGRLHPFAADYIDALGCALPDARGHAFLNIGQTGLPASALSQGIAAGAGGCRVDNPPPADRTLLCPSMDLRDVYYGLLGPDAVSVTYRASSGALATEPAAGPDGAYLVVLRYARGRLQGTATIGTGLSGGPLVSVLYRDGHTCATSHGHTCLPVGYRSPRATHLTAAQVRAPISARVVAARSYCSSRHNSTVVPCDGRVRRGFSRITGAPLVLIDISFTARLPVANSHSRYQIDFSYASSPGCTVGGVGGPTNADIHAGQRIHMQDFHPLSCPGPVHGVVRYVQGSALGPLGLPGSPRATSVLVGRFVVNPTTSQPASR